MAGLLNCGMSELTFLWHDYETFGRAPRRDRPSQYAGVRSDAELNEIGEPLVQYCQPAPDYLPQPAACLLTGILPQECLRRGVPEHRFAAAILEQLAQPGTVGVGYNSIRFDDEVTRHLFWRNLIDPYAREWQHDCGRWDLLHVVRCCWALRPQGIEWPQHADGRVSFKLEDLSGANGLAHGSAHDALSDVRATLALARLVKARQPRLWEFCLRLRHKAEVAREIAQAQGQGRPLLHVSGVYGVQRGCMALVWPLGVHPTNKNEIIAWDLAHDPQLLLDLSAQQTRERLHPSAADLQAGVQRLPITTLQTNKSPIVVADLRTLGDEQAQRFGLDRSLAQRHLQALAPRTPELAQRWPLVYERQGDAAPVDAEEDLYAGFVGAGDRRLLERLRHLDGRTLAEQRPAFADPRLDALVFRYRARNFPDTLDAQEQAHWLAYRSQRLHGGDADGQSLTTFLEEIERLGEQADERGQEILGALVDYATDIAPDRA